jgi:uncharacterized protein Yka (UPF0111/DUF47 family)
MADHEEDESIRLLFKAGGLDVVTDAKDSFHHLTEEMKGTAIAAKTVDTTTADVMKVLNETSDVTQRLKSRIAELEGELDKLKDAFRAGLIDSESAFLERAADFESGIARHRKALALLEGEGDEGGLFQSLL